MGRIKRIKVHNYRSVREPIGLELPEKVPLVLVGENNSGKSNLVHALELLMGETYPGNYELEDHEFHNRDESNVPVEIEVEVEQVDHVDQKGRTTPVSKFTWHYPSNDERPFHMVFDNGQVSPYVSNETREKCLCIVVGADRRLSYQLSYTSKYTFLSKLMRRFHRVLTADLERVAKLRGKFEETKELFKGVSPFAVFTAELQGQVAELSANLEYSLDIDFSAYDPSNYFHALRVYPSQHGEVRTFEELGTGQEQILALSFAYAYAKAFHGDGGGLVVVTEEPEVHLHPLAQEWVGRKVRELAEKGVQVIITTHSPAFLNILNLEGIVLVCKENESTRCTQLSRDMLASYCRQHGAPKANGDSILPFYAAAATNEILAGFFARRVILVEGPTEELALPVYLDRVGIQTTRDGIAVIPVHGVGNLAKWWRLFTAYGIPTYVVFDNDSRDDANGSKRIDILATLSASEEKLEEFLVSDEWSVEDDFSIFGVNFEETMRSYFGDEYIGLENEAREVYGLSPEQSKPLVARYVADHLAYAEDHEGWRCFKLLAEKIQSVEIKP